MDISERKRQRTDSTFHRHPWEIARGHIIIDLLRTAGNFPPDHIVDVGSGDGYIAGMLVGAGAARTYTAIDTAMDPGLAASLQKEIPQARFFTDLAAAGRQIPAADVILLLDVIEHVENDTALLTSIGDNIALAPDAKWIITVPAFQSLFSRHDTILGHYRRYTLARLTRTCRAGRLAVKKKGYFFFSLFLLRMLTRRKETGSTATHGVQDWKGGRRLTSFLVGLLWMDYKIGRIINKLGLNIPGLSCYCICHRLP
jgi:hypothetical protein